ncbi:MAG: protease modulator HflC [Alphaproteobacteria bacterium]|nr:protease modulator HflC [Alphaproteobacteria bacterium]
MNKGIPILIALVVIGAVLGFSSLFIVHQSEQALVVRLGAPRHIIQEPGLKFKAPFIDDVVRFDKRLLELDPPVEQVLLADQKRIEVDTFTRYRISDPLKFYQAFRNEENARTRLRNVVSASLRRVLGQVMLVGLLSEERTQIMATIQKEVNDEVSNNGIVIADVRIRRADLPEETSQSIYARMKSERDREAREFRAKGQEGAQQIRSRVERERTVLLAEAQKKAQSLRGEGDAISTRIFAEAFGQDPEFFSLYRSLQAYRESMTDGTSMVLSPNSEFFRYFGSMDGKPAASAAR